MNYLNQSDIKSFDSIFINLRNVFLEKLLTGSLGIEEVKVQQTSNLLMLARFKSFDAWSVDSVLKRNIFDSNLYELSTLAENSEAIIEVFRGKSPTYADDTDSKILNQKCIRFNAIEVEHAKTVDTDWLNGVEDTFLTQEHDILINSTGDGTIGRASLVSAEYAGLLYDSHIILLRLNRDLIDPLFFVYFNNSRLGQQQIENIKSAKSTKQTELGVGNLLKLKFPLPDIDTQRAIVAKIQSLEIEIEKQKAESMKQLNTSLKTFEDSFLS